MRAGEDVHLDRCRGAPSSKWLRPARSEAFEIVRQLVERRRMSWTRSRSLPPTPTLPSSPTGLLPDGSSWPPVVPRRPTETRFRAGSSADKRNGARAATVQRAGSHFGNVPSFTPCSIGSRSGPLSAFVPFSMPSRHAISRDEDARAAVAGVAVHGGGLVLLRPSSLRSPRRLPRVSRRT